MFPVLQIGPLALQTYLFSLLLAGWAGLAVAAWAGRRTGLDGDHIYNAGLLGLLGGLVVGRAAHVIAFWSAYRLQPLEIVGLNLRAFLLVPAVLGGLLVAAFYVYRHRLPLAQLLDAAAPGALTAVAVAGLGAFLSGETPGAPASVPWAISLWGVSRHPSQIYEVVGALIALAVVLRILTGSARPGMAAWTAVFAYGLMRWLLEPFRAESAVLLGSLRAAQVWGLAAALVALYALSRRLVYR